jgi:hypothetical protein
VTYRVDGEEHAIEACYVVGCDGADGWILVRPDAHIAWARRTRTLAHNPRRASVSARYR